MSIVHIGYHKTATTFLQNMVFPSIKEVNYVPYQETVEQLKDIYRVNTLHFNATGKESFKMQPNSLYSLEELVGTMGTGTYNYEIAQRLKEVGFQKIIITIRRQDRMVESIYRQHVQIGGVLKPKDFVNDSNYFDWSYLDYHSLIQRYSELFGAENIHIILQEELKENPTEVLSRLQKFVGTSQSIEIKKSRQGKNVSLSFWAIHFLRIINHFTNNYYKKSNLLSNKITTRKFRSLFEKVLEPYFFSIVFGKKDFYSASFKEQVKQDFKMSNQALNQKFQLGLEKYGYWE